MLSIRGLKKHYKNVKVLDVAELELPKGIFWIKGVNGSGKSTLLKICAGVLAFEGQVFLDEFEIKRDPKKYRALVNYAEAEPLYPEFLTGKELVQFYNKIKAGHAEANESLLDRLGVSKFYTKKIGTYSSGMCKKLSLALAFIGNPKLILLDEPLVTLDALSVPILAEIIEEYYQQGVSFLLTSHQSLQIPELKITQEVSVQNGTVCLL